MKIALPFLDKFVCSYSHSVPVTDNDKNTRVGIGEIQLEDNKHTAQIQVEQSEIKEKSYIGCKCRQDEKQVLHIDEIILSSEKPNNDFSIQLANVIF